MRAVVLEEHSPAAHGTVNAPAWRILGLTAAVVLVVVLGALLCLAAFAYDLGDGQGLRPTSVWLPFAAPVLLWSLHSVLRASLPLDPGVVVTRDEAPGLHALVERTAEDVGVAPPERVLLGLTCSAAIVHREGTVLVVGAPLVWGLSAQELREVLLPVLASAPEHRLRGVRWALAVSERLHRAPLRRAVTGPLLRPLRTATGRAHLQLHERIAALAAVRVGDRSTLAPETAERLLEGWELVLRGFAAPAWSRGLRPTHLLAALADVMSGSEQVWWTGSRGPVELDTTLLDDPEEVDTRLSWLLATRGWGGRPGEPLAWPDYLERVVGPTRRERAARLLVAVDVVLGASGPATPSRVLDALDAGAGPAVHGVLRGHRDDDDTLPDRYELTVALVALTSCAAETSGAARSHVTWGTGPVLVGHDGWGLPDLHDACARAAHGRTAPLRTALAALDLPADGPVWLAGDEPADVGPRAVMAVADIWHQGRVYDLVVCEDRVVLVQTAGRGLDVRGAVEHYAGDDIRTFDRLQRTVDGDVEAVLADSPHHLELRFADIVDARIRAVLGQLMWWATITTVDGRRIVLRNGRSPGTVFALQDLLTPVLGDRLHVRGVQPRFPRLARLAPTWALVCAGAALALGLGAAYVASAGAVVPAALVGQVDATTCTVQFEDPWDGGQVRTRIDCPRLLTPSVDVLALPAPMQGDAMLAAGAGGGLAVALTLLLAPAAVGSGLRIRRTWQWERDRRAGD